MIWSRKRSKYHDLNLYGNLSRQNFVTYSDGSRVPINYHFPENIGFVINLSIDLLTRIFQAVSLKVILFFRFVTNRRNKLPDNLYLEKRCWNKRNVVSNARSVQHYANARDCIDYSSDIDLFRFLSFCFFIFFFSLTRSIYSIHDSLISLGHPVSDAAFLRIEFKTVKIEDNCR